MRNEVQPNSLWVWKPLLGEERKVQVLYADIKGKTALVRLEDGADQMGAMRMVPVDELAEPWVDRCP